MKATTSAVTLFPSQAHLPTPKDRRRKYEMKVVCDLQLGNLTPQQAIKHLTDIIGRQKQEDKRWLRIEEYEERYGHPFNDGDRALRIINVKPSQPK